MREHIEWIQNIAIQKHGVICYRNIDIYDSYFRQFFDHFLFQLLRRKILLAVLIETICWISTSCLGEPSIWKDFTQPLCYTCIIL